MQSTDHEMPLKGLTALIADDLDFVRDALERALTRFGAEVHHACDGLEAVERFEAVKPDVLLIDGQMPRMTGGEAIERIRATNDGRSVLVVALSGDGDERPAPGVDVRLSKPITPAALLTAIRTGLQRHGGEPRRNQGSPSAGQ